MRAVISIFLIFFSGCATHRIPRQELHAKATEFSPPAGKSNIYFFRLADIAVIPVEISIDNKGIGALPGFANTYIYRVLNPGEYEIAVPFDEKSKFKLKVDANKNYYFKLKTEFGFNRFVAVNEENGKKEILQREPVAIE
jgi:hypothetical protein